MCLSSISRVLRENEMLEEAVIFGQTLFKFFEKDTIESFAGLAFVSTGYALGGFHHL